MGRIPSLYWFTAVAPIAGFVAAGPPNLAVTLARDSDLPNLTIGWIAAGALLLGVLGNRFDPRRLIGGLLAATAVSSGVLAFVTSERLLLIGVVVIALLGFLEPVARVMLTRAVSTTARVAAGFAFAGGYTIGAGLWQTLASQGLGRVTIWLLAALIVWVVLAILGKRRQPHDLAVGSPPRRLVALVACVGLAASLASGMLRGLAPGLPAASGTWTFTVTLPTLLVVVVLGMAACSADLWGVNLACVLLVAGTAGLLSVVAFGPDASWLLFIVSAATMALALGVTMIWSSLISTLGGNAGVQAVVCFAFAAGGNAGLWLGDRLDGRVVGVSVVLLTGVAVPAMARRAGAQLGAC